MTEYKFIVILNALELGQYILTKNIIIMSTISIKPSDVKREWILIDAKDLVLGRMAAEVAKILCGKHKAYYTPNIDCGDNVIIINASKVHLTGKKITNKKYYKHTGHPGGIKETTPEKILAGKHGERVVQKAIERMIDGGPLGRAQFKKLYVYTGDVHPHEGQQPKALDFGAKNPKNKKAA